MGKHRKDRKLLDRALEATDDLEEMVGIDRAPAIATIVLRLLAGSEVELARLLSQSSATIPWATIEAHHASAQEPDDEDDDLADVPDQDGGMDARSAGV